MIAVRNEILDWPSALAIARRASPHYSLSEREQELLFEVALGLPQGALIVELGVCNGKTALILAQVARVKGGSYWGVDDWSLEGSMLEVLQLLVDASLDANALLLEGSTHTALLPPRPIDLLLIDAGHQEEAVSVDCERWIPRVRPGGLVAFDDWPGEWNWKESPHAAVRKHADLWTQEWTQVMFWGKLLVRRKPL